MSPTDHRRGPIKAERGAPAIKRSRSTSAPVVAVSIAASIRAYAAEHPSATQAEIAAALGCTRQAAHNALRATGQRGRPTDDGRRPVTIRLRPEVLQLARAEAERDGIALQAVLESAVEASLVPESQWTARARRNAKR